MSNEASPPWNELERVAREHQQRAYAPYSNYAVGAALWGDDGHIYGGCNVENATYGLTLCAERVALGSMVATGCRIVRAALVVTPGPHAGSPCGMCRQALAEFCTDAPVRLLAVAASGQTSTARATSVAALLPDRFHGDLVTTASR